jgi:Arc/MetJ family transcription regulator
MTRTTVRLPDELLAAAQQRARETGRTFTDLLADALRNELRAPLGANRVCEPLPTYLGRGLRAGVDLSDNSALHDLMDDR